MVYTCCVPNCKGNYPNGPKVQVFSFPKEKEFLNKWIKAIHRSNFKPKKFSKEFQLVKMLLPCGEEFGFQARKKLQLKDFVEGAVKGNDRDPVYQEFLYT